MTTIYQKKQQKMVDHYQIEKKSMLLMSPPPTPPPALPAPIYFDAKSLLFTTIDNQSIELISILGIGAYGVVYLGQNVFSKQYFAVKLLTHVNSNSKKEIDIHAHLSGGHHPNILKFEKVIYENNKTFMVIEYIPEGDLFSALTSRNQHYYRSSIVGNNDSIRYIFLQLIDVVHYCHQNNISHRDLKPENIMLNSKLQVKLADFGLATTEQVSNQFGCGSTIYFSPECQGGIHHRIKGYSTQKNDIWSLGIILINLTAGRNPWKQATTKNSSFASYVRSPRHFFRKILPCISEDLEKILLRIFCLNPSKRISLPELRHYILKCPSFVAQQYPKQQQQQTTTPPYHQQNENFKNNNNNYPSVVGINNRKRATPSMYYTQTMLFYVNSFTDEED